MKLSLGGAWGRLGLGLALAAVARADMLASEEPFLIDDGGNRIEAVLKGYAGNNHMEDMSQFTMVADASGEHLVYGETDEVTGRVIPTDCRPGNCNPGVLGIATRQTPSLAAHLEDCGDFCIEQEKPPVLNQKILEYKMSKQQGGNGRGSLRRNLATGMTLKNLVVLLRFKDHKARKLPSKDDYEKLFNSEEPVAKTAPSGSIRNLFKQNSFDELTLDSVVHGWIDLNITESEAAFPSQGIGSKALARAMIKALEDLEARGLVDFSEFDVFNLNTQAFGEGQGDKSIDAVTFIHSGYGAEWGGTDCKGAYFDNRIWSHKYAIYPILRHEDKKQFISKEDIVVNTYHISPGLWGTCNEEIGRIGVIAHETGHFLGITDLYDTNGGGTGIGSYCLMANSWGFDGSQYYPPVMSAWTKIELGYVEPTEITTDQINQGATFSIGDSSRHAEAFKITYGFPSGEYLLIENRLAVEGYLDYKIPGDAGLAIWHIDMNAASHSEEGYPGQPSWPENGDHYKIALLQADGDYHLEKGQGRGGSGDLFNSQGAYEINPNGVMYADGTTAQYPNTDTYSGGNVAHTMIRIFDISESQEQMSFSVGLHEGGVPTASPTKAPTMNPTYDSNSSQQGLSTTMASGNGRNGNTFSITAKTDVMINGLVLHIGTEDFLEVKIYLVQGGHYDTSSSANKVESEWELYSTTNNVKGMGLGTATNFNIENPIQINQGETMGFYVVLNERVLKYTSENDANKRNKVTYASDDIEFIQGFGMSATFSEKQYNGRVFNGGIKYTVSPTIIDTASPTKLPTEFPTASPTKFPTPNPVASPTRVPTASPTRVPTASPTRVPTASPTKFPTSIPVASPTNFPTKNPTPNPVTTPTSKPVEDYVEESRTMFTLLSGGNGQAGNMFEIVALRNITFESLSLHVDTTNTVEFYVFSKQGALDDDYIKTYRNLNKITDTPWGDSICHGKVKGNGRGNLTPLPEGLCKPVTIEQGQKHSFYVTLTTRNIDYTNAPSLGAEFAKNNDIIVLAGYGKKFPFHRAYKKRVWNGEFKYTTRNDVDAGETVYPIGPTLNSGTGDITRDGGLQSDCDNNDECDTGFCNASKCENAPPTPRGRGRKRKRRKRAGKRGGTRRRGGA
eukprot:CAMPEP_0198287054 /NCGR_PEP_ID=MMETSP1449-20131203/5991_1 /TAXON_ID=420275 /ORGANISM="Attheya septentrionalis, Strain CCMP2084" /LENGTH=1128 /DNA_ID=CAMNT_0043984949 /DNA_START=159 /DNA_END=3545 /DNA_ORIENTATION=+